jgi:hypothetical protein
MIALAFSTRRVCLEFIARHQAILRNESVLCRAFLMSAFLALGFQESRAGSIVREVWNNIPGTAVSDLTNDPR